MSFKPAGSSKPTLPVPPVHSPTHSRTSGTPDAPTDALPTWSRAQPSPHQSDWGHWGLVLMTGSLALLVLAAMAMLTLALLYRSDLIMPGVRTLGVELGGKRKAEAVMRLQQSWLARTVILDGGDTTWSVTPPMLGIMLDAEATAQIAYQQGRSLETLKDVFKAKGRIDIAPVWRIDLTIAEANLQALAPQFDVPPVDAGLQVVDGRVEATPAVSGRALDVAATVAWLEQNEAQVINQGRLNLVMVPVQPAVTDTSGVVAQADQLLANSLSIRGYDPITDQTQMWTIGPDVWGGWLSLGVDPDDATRLNWELNTENAGTFLEVQAAVLGSDRYLDLGEATTAVKDAVATHSSDVRVRIYHHSRQHIVQSGETLSSIARDYGIPYPWIQEANPGVGDALFSGQVLTVPSPDVLLPLPVVENKRIVVSLSQQKTWVYENGNLKWEWPLSTGISSSPTSPGVFQVQTHEPNAYASNWNLWMPYFMGIYRPVPTSDFMNGFHGFPTRNGSTLLWTGDLGHPVTYGCILISTENAISLYEWAEEGVVVEIRP
jgi:LysM repeat protein